MKAKLNQYAFVISQLTLRELKRKYARSYLGILWSVLNPLLSMALLSLIFSQLFRRQIDNYPIYYLTGYILWQAFVESTTSAMTTLVDNKGLLIKTKLPLDLFILTRVYASLVNLGYSTVAYIVMLIVFRISFKWTMLVYPFIVLLLMLFAAGLSYLLSAAYVFFGDIRHLYSVLLTLWMYLSAIFYPAEQLTGPVYTVIQLNPIYRYIKCLRGAVMYGQLFDPFELMQMVLWSIFMFALGLIVFKKMKNKIIEAV